MKDGVGAAFVCVCNCVFINSILHTPSELKELDSDPIFCGVKDYELAINELGATADSCVPPRIANIARCRINRHARLTGNAAGQPSLLVSCLTIWCSTVFSKAGQNVSRDTSAGRRSTIFLLLIVVCLLLFD